MQNKDKSVLALILAAILSLGITSTTIPTQSQLLAQEEENGNGGEENGGNGEEDSAVQVTVEREGAETEDINVTPNVTVVVDFEQTQVTNESVTIGPLPNVTEPATGGNQSEQNQTIEVPTEGGAGNETEQPPTTPGEETPNGTTPAGNETTTPPVEGNVTVPIEGNVTVPEEGGNETIPVEPEVPATGGNETTTEPVPFPPINDTIPIPIPSNETSGNETIPIPLPINETDTNQTVPIPPLPVEPELPPTGETGNQTEELPDEIPAENSTDTIPIEVPINSTTGNETIPVPPIEVIPPTEGNVTGNETAPPTPPEPETPPVVIPPGNNTGPPTLPNGTIPVDNGTTIPVEPPVDRPTDINLALIESIQRGHIQHVTPFVTDESGNEFTDEQVNIQVVNARNKTLQNVEVTSGQDFAFKVGPNTSPQTIWVYATLNSDSTITEQASYEVFPKPQVTNPIELPPPIMQ
jgi:hypothetical protein